MNIVVPVDIGNAPSKVVRVKVSLEVHAGSVSVVAGEPGTVNPSSVVKVVRSTMVAAGASKLNREDELQ